MGKENAGKGQTRPNLGSRTNQYKPKPKKTNKTPDADVNAKPAAPAVAQKIVKPIVKKSPLVIEQ